MGEVGEDHLLQASSFYTFDFYFKFLRDLCVLGGLFFFTNNTFETLVVIFLLFKFLPVL